jgi:hypothetical protein
VNEKVVGEGRVRGRGEVEAYQVRYINHGK